MHEIKAIAITCDVSSEKAWNEVAEGKYNVMLASPESLLNSTGYFWNYVLRKRSGVLYSKIVAVAIDECHCVETWGASGFQGDYTSLGVLREAFPNIPFVGLTATMTPMAISYFFKSVKFRNPVAIKQTIRRKNLSLWVAPITGTDYEDLRVLLPARISATGDIPQTMIFYNARVGCGRIANWRRSQLPPDLQSKARTIIRSYNGILDEPSRQETLDLLRSGDCRIVVCTDAFGLGMNIKAIPRVVLWKLNSKLGIDGFYQRIGRAGRDSDATALALIFVTKANLSGEYTKDEEEAKRKKPAAKTKTKTKNPTETSLPSENELAADAADAADNEFRYTIPVCRETQPIYQSALADIYAGPTKKTLASSHPSESKLVHGIHWTLHIDSCRTQPILVAFDDEEMMQSCEHPTGCDKCVMKRLIQTDTAESLPTLHGIPFTITMAYQAHLKTLLPKVPRQRKAPARTITPPLIAKLVEDIKVWRGDALKGLAEGIAGMKVEIIFPNGNIDALTNKAKHIRSEDDLRAALKECGYSLPASFISNHIKELYDCIERSLKESQPPAQLEQAFRQAERGSRVRVPALPAFKAPNSTAASPSVPPLPRHEEQLNAIPTKLVLKSALLHWPIPWASPQVPQVTIERPPLAEKSASMISGINVEPKEPAHAHSSGYNLRGAMRKKRQVGDENEMPVICAPKRRKVKGTN